MASPGDTPDDERKRRAAGPQPAIEDLPQLQKTSFSEDLENGLPEASQAFKNSFNNPGGSTTSEHRLLREWPA
ncbi:hypothetical protein [Streptosporangium sp. NPDC049644]|uniref:hypothetical protein n=1 Tax=Streptosporangium sp. NPDC049644 TaxID=3155507 RepID=UPI00342E3BCE